MLTCSPVFPQYQPPLSKAQNPRKILDTRISGGNTYSATQQLSNSGVKEDYARISGRLFYFKPQRVPRMRRQIEENIPFKTLASSASLRLIKIKPLSIQRSQRKVEKKFNKSSLFRSFAGSAYFAVTLRTKPVKNVQNSKYSSINLVPHNYTLQIVHYPLFLALYRRSRQTVWFDSG